MMHSVGPKWFTTAQPNRRLARSASRTVSRSAQVTIKRSPYVGSHSPRVTRSPRSCSAASSMAPSRDGTILRMTVTRWAEMARRRARGLRAASASTTTRRAPADREQKTSRTEGWCAIGATCSTTSSAESLCASMTALTCPTTPLWPMAMPFGRPEDPDVYETYARLPAFLMRWSTSAGSSTPRPSITSVRPRHHAALPAKRASVRRPWGSASQATSWRRVVGYSGSRTRYAAPALRTASNATMRRDPRLR